MDVKKNFLGRGESLADRVDDLEQDIQGFVVQEWSCQSSEGEIMKTIKATPHIESPTWGHLQRMAERVIEELGGPKESCR